MDLVKKKTMVGETEVLCVMLEGLNGSEDCKDEQKRAMGHQRIQRKLLRRKRRKWGTQITKRKMKRERKKI